MASEAIFSAQTDVRNDVAHIALNGELDLATVPLLEDRFARLEADGVKTLMLDLRDVSFVDSAGIHSFVAARERAELNGHRFVLIGASAKAQRLFGITGDESLLAEQDPVQAMNEFTHVPSSQVSQPLEIYVDAHVI